MLGLVWEDVSLQVLGGQADHPLDVVEALPLSGILEDGLLLYIYLFGGIVMRCHGLSKILKTTIW